MIVAAGICYLEQKMAYPPFVIKKIYLLTIQIQLFVLLPFMKMDPLYTKSTITYLELTILD